MSIDRITLLTNLCEKDPRRSFRPDVETRRRTRSNAVIGARYDATELMQGVTEVLAYATAVVVERSAAF